MDPNTGNLYITDEKCHVIRMISKSTGIITTIAGNGTQGKSGDGGPATSALLDFPSRVAIDALSGNIYVTEPFNRVIRMITKSTGIITTIAGAGTKGKSGDGGPATLAMIGYPSYLAIDSLSGNIYISEPFDHVIRMITRSTGIITTVAGTGRSGYTGDGGPAAHATLSYPYSVTIDASSGIMYIADSSNNVVRSVVLTLNASSSPSASPVATPSVAVNSIPTAAPSSAGEIRYACLCV